jgi:HEAT repeat protein
MAKHGDSLLRLKEAIKSDDEDRIFRAALSVGDSGKPAGVSALVRLLRSDARIRVKNGAAIALRELRANEAVPHLIRLIESGDFQRYRGTFIYALQTLDWYSKYSYVVARLLTDTNFEVRAMAFDALNEAAETMSEGQKGTMLAALLLRVAAKFHFPALLPEDVAETVEAAVPLLVTKQSMRAAEPVLV